MTVAVQMDKLLKMRAKMNDIGKVRISVNDLLVKAIGLSCEEVPETNSHWYGDYIRQFTNVDVSVAVAMEEGLITPIVTDVTNKSLSRISKDTKALIEKARDGKLRPEEYTGGTVTISNLGMTVVDHFSAIINPP